MMEAGSKTLNGEVLPPLHRAGAEERSFAPSSEADLAARQWRRWLQTSRGREPRAFRRQALVDVLCGAALSGATRGSPQLRPLWTDEALHRAASMLQLLLLLEERLDGRDTPLSVRGELVLAKKLNDHFRALAAHPDHVLLPCNAILGSVATLITELFSPVVGHVSFALDISDLQLPAYRRRALTLAAANVIMQTMLFGFLGSVRGEIHTQFAAAGGKARLQVLHDGCNGENVPRSKAFYVVSAMSDLLDGHLACRASRTGGAIEMCFAI